MRRPRVWAAGILGLLGLLAAPAPSLLGAGQDNGFLGLYWIEQTADLGVEVQVEIRLRVVNQTGADVVNGTVFLTGLFADRDFATFYQVDAPNGGYASLSDSVLVPREQYQRWSIFESPIVTIRYWDAAGHQRERKVPVHPMPLPEGR